MNDVHHSCSFIRHSFTWIPPQILEMWKGATIKNLCPCRMKVIKAVPCIWVTHRHPLKFRDKVQGNTQKCFHSIKKMFLGSPELFSATMFSVFLSLQRQEFLENGFAHRSLWSLLDRQNCLVFAFLHVCSPDALLGVLELATGVTLVARCLLHSGKLPQIVTKLNVHHRLEQHPKTHFLL